MSHALGVRPLGDAPDDAVAELVRDRVASRIGAGDPTLWGKEAEAEAASRLGWVDLPRSSRPLLAEIDAVRAALSAEGLDRVVLCGMGGSSLAPELFARTYNAALEVLDSTNPSVLRRALGKDLDRTVVVVSSKSGATTETDSHRRAFEAAFRAAGIEPATRLVVVTDPGSPLADLAEEAGYRHLFLANPNVGGRYSALTAFGLVPAGLAGVDVAELLDEAEEAMAELHADSTGNPALVLAGSIAGRKGRDKLVLADAGSGLAGLSDWAEQLLAESTGKQGTGLLPVVVEGPDAPEAVTEANDLLAAVLERAGSAPLETPLPGVAVSGPLGAQLLVWETATAAAGRLLGINPFDQPDVESAKQATRGLLEQHPDREPPRFTDGAVEVRGSAGLLDGVSDIGRAVEALLGRLDDDGYLAVMAYLDPVRDAGLRRLRAALARRTGRPVTFGWGPRFLHSTGQYHKGGPAKGVFVQLTADEPDDVEIPGRPFTFGQLIWAQAAGDASVLEAHGRPVLRLHLRDPGDGAAQVEELLR